MERLTKRLPNGSTAMDCDSCGLKTSRKCTLYKCRNQLMRRVAAYEDTDLTPEDLNEPFTWQIVLNQASQKALGMEPNRLRKLAEADKDGRVVILPCKVGDTVYRVFNPQGREPVISAHTLLSVDYIVRWLNKFGKTVFLTREEAERVMEGRKEADHA